MPLYSLPDECFSDILAHLNNKSLYKCLFVNRYYCKFSVSLIWRNPFKIHLKTKAAIALVNTLLACLNEDEISSLIPYVINLNLQSPLFEYGRFVRKIDHDNLAVDIMSWLRRRDDCRVQKLVNVIYHMIFRSGSNIQEFRLKSSQDDIYTDLPKSSIFAIYKPGITNLNSLDICVDLELAKNQNIIEFLNTISKSCNYIVNYELQLFESNRSIEAFLNIIKSQPLKKITLKNENVDTNKLIKALKCRSNTLQVLSFDNFDFQNIDVPFVSELRCLKSLEFQNCFGFTSKHFENSKLQLKELSLWHNAKLEANIIKSMINFLVGESLLKLSSNIINTEMVEAIVKFCSNIAFLHIKFLSSKFFSLIIPPICELSTLKVLHIQIELCKTRRLVDILSDSLTSVEYLSLDFHVELPNFVYFTRNCRANLKILNILVSAKNISLRKSYLHCVINYQEIHKSLKLLGMKDYNIRWSNEESVIIDSLQKQGVVVSSLGVEFLEKDLNEFRY